MHSKSTRLQYIILYYIINKNIQAEVLIILYLIIGY